jgi:general secretion pathway protein M
MINNRIDGFLARYSKIATISYFAIVVALMFATWSAIADLYQRRQAVAAATYMLDQLNGRIQNLGGVRLAGSSTREGSPFLEGQTITVAGAALLQRVADAVTRVGSSVLSSQVDVDNPKSKQGLVSLIVSCEIAEPDLQKLLYDLEAGMPYLFLDQLVVQAPDRGDQAGGGRLRVLLAVSGQWQTPQ